jgi:hypothetical protein
VKTYILIVNVDPCKRISASHVRAPRRVDSPPRALCPHCLLCVPVAMEGAFVGLTTERALLWREFAQVSVQTAGLLSSALDAVGAPRLDGEETSDGRLTSSEEPASSFSMTPMPHSSASDHLPLSLAAMRRRRSMTTTTATFYGLPPPLVRRLRLAACRLERACRLTRKHNPSARVDHLPKRDRLFPEGCRILAALWKTGLVPRSCMVQCLWLPQLVMLLQLQLTPRQATGAVFNLWSRASNGEVPMCWSTSGSQAFAVATTDLLLLHSPASCTALDKTGLGVVAPSLLCLERLFIEVLPLPAALVIVDRFLEEGISSLAEAFVTVASHARPVLEVEMSKSGGMAPQQGWDILCQCCNYPPHPVEASALPEGEDAEFLVDAELRGIRVIAGTCRPWMWRAFARCLGKAVLWARSTAAPLAMLPRPPEGHHIIPLLPPTFPNASKVFPGSGPAWTSGGSFSVPAMSGYAWIGFDADFTVIEYIKSHLEAAVFAHAIEVLQAPAMIHQKSASSIKVMDETWIASLMTGPCQPEAHLSKCGTVIDRELGNILRLSASGEVIAAWHGSTQLSPREIAETYGGGSLTGVTGVSDSASPAEDTRSSIFPGLRFCPGWNPPPDPWYVPKSDGGFSRPGSSLSLSRASTPDTADGEDGPSSRVEPLVDASIPTSLSRLLVLHSGFEAPVAPLLAMLVSKADAALGSDWTRHTRDTIVAKRRGEGWGGFAGQSRDTVSVLTPIVEEGAPSSPVAASGKDAVTSYDKLVMAAVSAVQICFQEKGIFGRIWANPSASHCVPAAPRLREWLVAIRKTRGTACPPKAIPRISSDAAMVRLETVSAESPAQAVVSHGPRVFLLTNASWKGVAPLLRFALGADWPNLFDLVITDAGKKKLFLEPWKAQRRAKDRGEFVPPPHGRRTFDRVSPVNGRRKYAETSPNIEEIDSDIAAVSTETASSRAGRVARLQGGAPAGDVPAALPHTDWYIPLPLASEEHLVTGATGWKMASHLHKGGRVWACGNAWDLQATLALYAPTEDAHRGVLYIGDHVGTDVVQPGLALGWHSVCVSDALAVLSEKVAAPEPRLKVHESMRETVDAVRRASMAIRMEGAPAARTVIERGLSNGRPLSKSKKHHVKIPRGTAALSGAFGWGGLEVGESWACSSHHCKLVLPSVSFWVNSLQTDPLKPASLVDLRKAYDLNPIASVSMAPVVPSVSAIAFLTKACWGDETPTLGAPVSEVVQAAKFPATLATAPVWHPGMKGVGEGSRADPDGQWRLEAATAVVDAILRGDAVTVEELANSRETEPPVV